MAAAFLAVAVPLAAHAAPGASPPPRDRSLRALYAAASVVEFEVGTGAAVPTQLVLVPMLFVLPLGVVPLAAACGFVAGDLVRAAFRTGERARPLTLIGSSWYADRPHRRAHACAGAGRPPGTAGRSTRRPSPPSSRSTPGAPSSATRLHSGCGRRSRCAPSAGSTASTPCSPRSGSRSDARGERHGGGAHRACRSLVVIALFARDRRARTDALIDLSRTYRGTALVLGDVIEADDTYTGTHSRNVFELSLAVADELRLGPLARREVEFTSLLHDIGDAAH